MFASKQAIKFLVVNPKIKRHKALYGVLNRPQSALWCFDYYCCLIKPSELAIVLGTVRKHSGHKIYSARNLL